MTRYPRHRFTKPMKIGNSKDFLKFVNKCKELVHEYYEYDVAHPDSEQRQLYADLDNNLSILAGWPSAEEISRVESQEATLDAIMLHLNCFVFALKTVVEPNKQGMNDLYAEFQKTLAESSKKMTTEDIEKAFRKEIPVVVPEKE